MTGDSPFSPADDDGQLSPNLETPIEEGSQNSEELLHDECNDLELEGDDIELDGDDLNVDDNGLENDCVQMIDTEMIDIEMNNFENKNMEASIIDGQDDVTIQKRDYLPPVVGLEFKSYDDAYNYYNCYAKELGFAIRVKSSWTKRNSKEKRGAVLCCNCEGFKTVKDANNRRKETRTGCLAMIRLRLVESNRWKVDEVKLEHNHSFDPERAQNSKSHKKMDVAGTKRKAEPTVDVEVRTIKLYRTPVSDSVGYRILNDGEISNHGGHVTRLKLRNGDLQAMHSFFHQFQLTDPNFFYVMDFNDEGCVRNIFWIDSRSRAAYGYFGDVVAIDRSCLSNNFEVPLLVFVGINQHGQSISLGCGFLADETIEAYIWLFRAWLTCMCGRTPQTILSDNCKSMQNAIAEVFPRAHHCLYLSHVIQTIFDNLVEFQESEEFQTVLNRIVYNCSRVGDFEISWEDMVQRFQITHHEWLQSLYQDRERWAPVYVKDTFFAGMCNFQNGEFLIPFCDGYVHRQTSLKDFFEIYEIFLQKKHKIEAHDDHESRNSIPMLKTNCYYELQLSKLYTNVIFRKFQTEVLMMPSCISITQVPASGSITTYHVKEGEGEFIKTFEVMYDKTTPEVRCICSCFNFNGYLCRHALCILNYNGVEEIPLQYILSRWRKDCKRMYIPDVGSDNVDITNPLQWFDHLYRRATQVVEEGMISQDHYMVAWQAFKESLNKVRLVSTDKHI